MDECTTTAICAVNEHLSQIDAILKNAGFVRYLTASGDTGYDVSLFDQNYSFF